MTAFSFKPTTAGNGDEVTFKYDFTDSDWDKPLYFYYKIGSTIRYLGNSISVPSSSQTYSFSSRLIQFDVSGKTTIEGWIQSIQNDNPTEPLDKSNPRSSDFNYTSPPTIEKMSNLKPYYGYREPVSITVLI